LQYYTINRKIHRKEEDRIRIEKKSLELGFTQILKTLQLAIETQVEEKEDRS